MTAGERDRWLGDVNGVLLQAGSSHYVAVADTGALVAIPHADVRPAMDAALLAERPDRPRPAWQDEMDQDPATERKRNPD